METAIIEVSSYITITASFVGMYLAFKYRTTPIGTCLGLVLFTIGLFGLFTLANVDADVILYPIMGIFIIMLSLAIVNKA